MKPNPAVGQLWRMEDGEEFWIFDGLNGGFRYIAKFVVSAFDTYVGQFAGFRVKESAE